MAYHRQQGVDTAIVRIFNTYGPRMRPHDGRAIPTFLRQALQDRPLTVFGDGSQTRCFCYVVGPDPRDHRAGRVGLPPPVNVGNPDEFTLLRAGRGRDRGDRLALGDRLRGAADRRPAGAPARHRRSPSRSSAGSRRSACARACSGTIEQAGAETLVGGGRAEQSRNFAPAAPLQRIGRMPTTTADRTRRARERRRGEIPSAAADLAPARRDVRPQAPARAVVPAADGHAARAPRACCRCWRSTSSAIFLAIFTALALKAVVLRRAATSHAPDRADEGLSSPSPTC